MRCPKCGYISFDRQKTCGKCAGDLTVADGQLRGTGTNINPPLFLGKVLGVEQVVADEPVGDEAVPFVFNADVPPLDLGGLEAGEQTAGEAEEEAAAESLDDFDAEGRSDEEMSAEEQVDLDFAGAPVDEEEGDIPAPPALGLEDIDVSDLLPEQAEEVAGEEETVGEGLATLPGRAGDEEDGPESGELLSLLEREDLVLVGEAEEQESSAPAGEADDDVFDLSSLAGPADDSAAAESVEDDAAGPDFDFTLSLDDFMGDAAGNGDSRADSTPLHPGKEESEKKAVAGADAEKRAQPDIPDLGLSMERDNE